MPQRDAVPPPHGIIPSIFAGLTSKVSKVASLFTTSPTKPDDHPPAAPNPAHARPSSSSSVSRSRPTTSSFHPVFAVESDDEDSTRTAPRRVANTDQSSMADQHSTYAGAPAASSSKGKQREPWGGAGWGDDPVPSQAPSGRGRGRQEASSSSAWRAEPTRHGPTAYDVDLTLGVASSDQARAYQRQQSGMGRRADDEIQITHATRGGSMHGTQPYYSSAVGYQSSSSRGPPPLKFGNPGQPPHIFASGDAIPIHTPREQRVGDGPSVLPRYGTNGERDRPYGNAPPPLRGAKAAPQLYHPPAVSLATRDLLEAERRAQLSREKEETRAREKARHAETKSKKKGSSNPFNPGKNTIDSSPASATPMRPPPGQAAGLSSSTLASPYFAATGPPSSNRNGGERHPVASGSRGPPVQTPTQPARRDGPAANSRVFVAGGDAVLMQAAPRNHANLEVLPQAKGSFTKPPCPDFKKKIPPAATPAAPRAEIALLYQRRTSAPAEVIDLSGDDEPLIPLSQQTDDIGTFDDEQAPPSVRNSPAVQAAAPKGGGVQGLLDGRPPPNLDPLPPVKGLKPRPAPPPDDDEPIPINMPKQGSIKLRSIVGRMAPKNQSLNHSVPTSLTRRQVKQLSGGVLELPGATIVVPGPQRQCLVYIYAEMLAIATRAHDTIVELPLFFIKELEYSNESGGHYLMKITLDPVGLPPAFEQHRETILVWKFPMQGAIKLENNFDRIPELPQLREVRRLDGAQKKKMQLTRMTKPSTEKLIRRVENLSKKPASTRSAPAASAVKTRAAVDLGPISIDESDEDLEFPDLKPPPAASVPQSAVARGKQRETRVATKDEPPREPPPANPNELMCKWPSTGRPEISILRGDYHRTTHKDEYLNDTLIDWGLKRSLAHERESNPSLDDDIYIFSSFLYFKLTEPHVLKAKKDPWENVRSWTTKKVEGKKEKELKIDLFKKKYIIVPINESYHWYLAIIVNPAAVLQPPPPKSSPAKKPPAPSQSKTTRHAVSSVAEPMDVDAEVEEQSRTSLSNTDSELLVVETRRSSPPKEVSHEGADHSRATDEAEAPPTLDDDDENAASDRQHGYVFILDSLGNATVKPAAVLSKYLRSEGIAHQGWDPDAEATTLTADKVDVPRQGDESSCGVYLLHYAEVFMRDPDGTVNFMLHKRKPKRSIGSSIPWKEAHEKYVEERDAFWDKPQLANKRAGYRQALLDLEKEHLAKLESAKSEGREPSTGSKSPASSPVAANDVVAPDGPDRPNASTASSRRPSPAVEAAAPPASASGDDAPAAASTQAEAAAGASTALDRHAAEGSPILPPSPPAEDAPSPVRSMPPEGPVASATGESDAMDMSPLRSMLPRRSPDDGSTMGSADEVASHVSASPDEPRSPPPQPQPQPQWATAAASPPPTTAVKALAVVAARSSEAEVALQTQATPRSSPTLEEIDQIAVIARAPTPQVIDDSDDDVVATEAGPSRQAPRKKRRLLPSPPAPVPSGQYFDPGSSLGDDGSGSDDDINMFSPEMDRHERKRAAVSPSGTGRAGKRPRVSPGAASAPPSQPAARFGPKAPPSPKGKNKKPTSTQSASSAPGGRKRQPRYQVQTGISDDEDDARSTTQAPAAAPLEPKLKQAALRAPGFLKADDVVVIDDENSGDNSDDSSLHGAGQPGVRKASVDV